MNSNKITCETRVQDEKHCCYCGKELNKDDKNSAADDGLHNIPDNVYCCNNCNKMITNVNKLIAQYMMNGQKEIKHLTEAVYELTYFRDAEIDRLRRENNL